MQFAETGDTLYHNMERNKNGNSSCRQGSFENRMDHFMDFYTKTAKLRKYPTAAAAIVFSAVFSFLLAPDQLLRTMDFYLVWVLSALFAAHIWYHFHEDRSYRVSGIVPAWIELFAGTLLLFFCPIREISLIFIMLAICSYAAGIIFSVKMTGPLILFLGIAPGLGVINRLLTDIMSLTFRNIYYLSMGKVPEFAAADCSPSTLAMTGTPQLFWAMLLAVFPLAVYLCKTAYERFSMYCVVFFVFFFCDLLRYLLLINIPGSLAPLISFWTSLIAGAAFVAGLLIAVEQVTKGAEKK